MSPGMQRKHRSSVTINGGMNITRHTARIPSSPVDSTKIIRHVIDVWTTKKPGHLIWSGTGETIDPDSGKEVHGEIVELITPELVNQGIIGPEQK